MGLSSAVPSVASAREEGRAIPLFVCVDMVATEAVIEATEEAGRTAIIGLYSGQLERPRGEHFARWARAVAGGSSAPLSLMLDHGRSVDICRRALSLGFTDVMYDGSELEVQENLENCRHVVEAARAVGVGVEAELGIVGSGSRYSTFGARGKGFTDPETAATFAAQSGCDILAVAVGSAHGQYNAEPDINLELLAEIRRRVQVPLSMHGGSGLSERQFRDAIRGGMAKVNIGTDLMRTAGRRVAEAARGEEDSYFALKKSAAEAFRERAAYYLELFARTPSESNTGEQADGPAGRANTNRAPT